MADLAPPKLDNHETVDPGAHDLSESSDEHFSDASEGTHRSRAGSIIPITRVERVDDEPAHGEVPGTAAYNLRTQDAVPDEIEVVPEGSRSRSTSRVSEADRPLTPGVPITVVEKVDDEPSHGEVPGTAAYEMRKADAEPDQVLRSPIKARQNLEGEPTPHRSDPVPAVVSEQDSIDGATAPSLDQPIEDQGADGGDEVDDEDDGFGDDFDDFEEGEEVEGDDFGDFGEASEIIEPTPDPVQPPGMPDLLEHITPLDFASIQSLDELDAALLPYLQQIFPDVDLDQLKSTPTTTTPTPLLSDRSASLWSQLVAPPALQPPNWIRSRIRRLFLVSLGVPVDLDEILPASKQKKLILPSIHLTSSPRASNNLARLTKDNASSTSVATTDSKGEPRRPKKKGPPERAGPAPPPAFDANSAAMIGATTEAALAGFTDEELKVHVSKLETAVREAQAVLDYWTKRRESALGDKEAFEGVIENLVGFVKRSTGKSKR